MVLKRWDKNSTMFYLHNGKHFLHVFEMLPMTLLKHCPNVITTIITQYFTFYTIIITSYPMFSIMLFKHCTDVIMTSDNIIKRCKMGV